MTANQLLVSGHGHQSSSSDNLENNENCSPGLHSSPGSERHHITLLLLNLKEYTSKLCLYVSFLKSNVSSKELNQDLLAISVPHVH